MSEVVSVNPATGESTPVGRAESTPADVVAACAAAAAAAPALAAGDLGWRASLLESAAGALEADSEAIVAVADAETALGGARLTGELRRTCYQLRFLAGVVRDGGFLEATIDHAHDSPMGPLPDLRRQLEPVGVVAVFGASNFPLAFSVPGGDTASALAAGCPVVVKAHPAHPATSGRCLDALVRGLAAAGAPDGAIAMVDGLDAGVALVEDERVAAVGFTGSYAAGRALFDRCARRASPIPFYGELGSVNPLVVTPAAAARRAAEIGEGIVGSVTLGSGQFCTKPGLLFVPAGGDGDAVVGAAREALAAKPGATMLTEAIRNRFDEGVERLASLPGVRVVARSAPAATAAGAGAALVETDLASITGEHRGVFETECFGALGVVVRYDDDSALLAALAGLEPALTFSVQAEAGDELGADLVALGARQAGRVVVNGYPTGVGVTWAMHHGGPLPAATSSLHTSVGASALRRWLRPVSYQATPDEWLPSALREGNPWAIVRRVDGALALP